MSNENTSELYKQILRDEQDEIITKGGRVALEAIKIGRRAERQKIKEEIQEKIKKFREYHEKDKDHLLDRMEEVLLEELEEEEN